MVTSSSTAYAQSQRASAAACPEGFQLSRGVCQAEPTLTCLEETHSHGAKIKLIDDQCVRIEYYTPGCPAGEYFELFTNRCEIGGTDEPSGSEPTCYDPRFPDTANHKLVIRDGLYRCEMIASISEPTKSCTVGMLNSATEMCEIKPGRRAA
jgi:hypothetical protein